MTLAAALGIVGSFALLAIFGLAFFLPAAAGCAYVYMEER